jgi:murein L,D-transpeptidase YafK
MRRAVGTLLAAAALTLIGVVGWDFLKLDRKLPPLAAPDKRATSILVEKQERRLTLFREGQAIKPYHVALGTNPMGPKQREGDSRTPEGNYTIDGKNGRSRFHLALHVSYPSAEDRERAARQGLSAGSDIMIHGMQNGLGWLGHWHLVRDWTDGCIAVTNAEIEDIWDLVDVGTAIQIRP